MSTSVLRSAGQFVGVHASRSHGNDALPHSTTSTGPRYLLGRRGVGHLQYYESKWTWMWPTRGRASEPRWLQCTQPVFPPMQTVTDDTSVFPVHVALASATQFVSDMRDPVETTSVLPIIHETIAQTHDQSKAPFEVTHGDILVYLDFDCEEVPPMLCFPMGQVGEQLNISPIVATPSRGGTSTVSLNASANPAETFCTPILQLTASPVATRSDESSALLAVRLAGSTRILKLTAKANQGSARETPVSISEVGELHARETCGRSHADVAFDPFVRGRAAIVDCDGGVWIWDCGKGRSELFRVRNPVSEGDFYRVSFGARSDTVLLLSRSKLVVIDFSSSFSEPQCEILICLDDGSQFTALDRGGAARNSGFTCLSTTRQLIWFDELHPKDRLLRWDHDFGGGGAKDITVAIVAEPGSSLDQTAGELVLLSSPSVDYVLGMRVSTSPHPAVVSLPWCITAERETLPLRSLVPICPPADVSPQKTFVLAAQYIDGSVVFVDVTTSTLLDPEDSLPTDCSAPSLWDPDITQLEDDYKKRDLLVTEVAATKHGSLHGRWAWHELHRPAAGVSLTDGKIDGLPELRTHRSHLHTAVDLACELRRRPPMGAESSPSTLTTPIDRSSVLEAFSHFRSRACRTGVDIDKHLREDVPTKVANDLFLSSLACHSATEPVLGSAALVREGFCPTAGEGPMAEGNSTPANQTEALGNGNMATVKRLVRSWDLGSDSRSWQWAEGARETHAHQTPGPRPIRNLPAPRTPPRTRPSRDPSQSHEPSMSGIPVVLPITQPSPALQSSASLPFPSTPPAAPGNAPPSLAVAQTQIEPGAYGSRAQVKRKPTAQRRRPGGF